MRFLRGLGVGFLMFVIWGAFSVLAAFSIIREYGLGYKGEISITAIPSIYLIPMVIGFFGMFIAPLYYWVIEPIRERGTSPRQTYLQPSQLSLSQEPGQQVALFCQNCGFENPGGQQFCGNCGANLILI
ncbi:MAG: zinc ribbon domain-containing protein [Candidatus Hodarchaeota archaeon]